MTGITFDPYIPLALWVPLALLAAAVLVAYGVASRRRLMPRRWPVVMTLMTLAAMVPLVILLNPTWQERIPPPAGKPLLTILVDRSASMATRDASDGESRYAAARGVAQRVARELDEAYEVRLRAFAGESSAVASEQLADEQPGGDATDLAAALADALEEDRPQGQAMLLLSDGIHNAGGGSGRLRQSLARAKALAAPVYAVTFGGPATVRDLELELSVPEELAFVAQSVPVVVTLRQRGSLSDRARVSLRLDGKTLEEREVRLDADGAAEETFSVTQKANGLYCYEFRAEPLSGEVTTVNNTAMLLLRVVDQPVRVLLLEGKPYWDTKFLVRTLSMDPSIELTSVVQLAPGRLLERKISRSATGERSASDPAGEPRGDGVKPEQPAGEDKHDEQPSATAQSDQWRLQSDPGKVLSEPGALESYQIVVLGRGAEAFLGDDALARLKKWLGEGEGSLVCFRGSPVSQMSQRLGELMPVRWSPSSESHFRVELTEAGRTLRWLSPARAGEDRLAGLPSLAARARPESPKPLAVVLAASASGGGPDVPLMTYQPVGRGRVVVVEGAGMWRWAFLPPQHQAHDDVYGLLWRSLVRWLVANVGLLPSQKFALRTDKITFRGDETAAAVLLTREDQLGSNVPQIEISGPALDRPRQIQPVPSGSDPGQFHVAFGRLPEGQYRARVIGAPEGDVSSSAAFEVRDDLRERLDLRAQPELMKLLAQETGGAVLEDDSPTGLARRFDEHLARGRPDRSAQTIAWDRWWVMLIACTIWGAAWGLRRWSGLI